MTRSAVAVFLLALATLAAVAPAIADNFVVVEGGAFKHPRSNFHAAGTKVSSFAISKYEVTQREWTEVMGANPSKFRGDDLPVDSVSWYDCIEYCNRRSAREGRQPYYTIAKDLPDPNNTGGGDDPRWTVTTNPNANGYRLPTEAEWEYAASGGQQSRGSTYSGADDAGKVAWFWENSGNQPLGGLWNWPAIEKNGNRPRPVGGKAPNELGLHDMSGNVREWCWDWHGNLEVNTTDPKGPARGSARVWKGGGWLGADFCCEPSFRGGFEPSGVGHDQGFRVCRAP